MSRRISLLLIALASCGTTATQRSPINARCPRSGEPVAPDALTQYRGFVVGFCNPHCRDDFAAHSAARPNDRAAFDAAIARLRGN